MTRKNRYRSGNYNSITMFVTMIFIGLLFSSTILIANDRGIIIDTIATELGIDAWEIAYLVYIMMLLIAVVYDMITDRSIHFDTNDILSMVMVGLISLFSFIALQTINAGSLSTAISAMQTENYSWWLFYTLIVVIYIANKFVVKHG